MQLLKAAGVFEQAFEAEKERLRRSGGDDADGQFGNMRAGKRFGEQVAMFQRGDDAATAPEIVLDDQRCARKQQANAAGRIALRLKLLKNGYAVF